MKTNYWFRNGFETCVIVDKRSELKTDAEDCLKESNQRAHSEHVQTQQPIHIIHCNGNTTLAQFSENGGYKMETVDEDGRRPIHMACKYGLLAHAQQLLDKGSQLEAEDQRGWRPIHLACCNGHASIVQMLLDRGCQTEAETKSGCRPIHRACDNGNVTIVQMLLDRGCQKEAETKSGCRPIHRACDKGNTAVVQLLLDRGCQKEAETKSGRRPIHFACGKGDASIVELLINNGCQTDVETKNGLWPLHFACYSGNYNLVHFLLDRGCQIDVEAKNGRRPIDVACENGNAEIVQLLLDSDCDFEASNEHGLRPIHWASYKGHSTVVQLLLERDCQKESATKSGWRPIHWACQNGHVNVVQLLLEKRCLIEAEDEKGWRPIHWACQNGHIAVIQLLLDYGCVIDAKTVESETPLSLTKEFVKVECEKMMNEVQVQRNKDEFQIFHFQTFSIINRKFRIYDLTDDVEKLKTEIPCINRPAVMCHLTEPLRRLLPSQKAFRMNGKGLKYQEYFVEDSSQIKDWQSQMAALRDWNVCVEVNASDSEINLQINKKVDQSKWRQCATARLDLFDEHSHSSIDTVQMFLMDSAVGADVKTAFVDFQRFVYCGKLFETFDGDQADSHDGIDWLNKWITMRKQMLTFYDSNREKLSNVKSLIASSTGNSDCRISVVRTAPEEIRFIPPLPRSQWTKESVAKILSQDYFLIRCITDDTLMWALPRNECVVVSDVENRLRSLVLNENGSGRLILIGANGQLSSESGTDNLDSIIHLAVVLPFANVKKTVNISSGSYAVVSECQIVNEGTIYAMKEMRICKNDSSRLIQSRINEIMVVSRIRSHPNVLKYRRFLEDKLSFYIIMDCMKDSLYDHVKKNYPLEETAVISFARQILEGLKHLHDQKVIHRDLKCSNVLLDENGCVKLCDFGISKCQNVDTDKAPVEGGKTQTGTFRYMAPEVIKDDRTEEYGQNSDIWTFGLTIVEMVTGKEPYSSLSDSQVFREITEDKRVEYEFPSSRYNGELKNFVDRCLVHDFHNRPTCAELLRSSIFA